MRSVNEKDWNNAFLATLPGDRPETPEINLSIACLREAISFLTRPSIPLDEEKDCIATIAWFAGEYDAYPGWSFAEIADRLGCDPDALRDRILDYAANNGGKTMRLFIRKCRSIDGL